MDEHQSKLDAGQIQFHQWCEPPLEPGDYNVVANQSVTEIGSFANNFSFSVAGPRFSLDPADIYSVYPPKGYLGDFANSLSHVVFTGRSLPWERSVDPGPRNKDDRRPWMALLVVSAADFPPDETFPKPKVLKVGDLINPKSSDPFVGPVLASANGNGLQAYEKEED